MKPFTTHPVLPAMLAGLALCLTAALTADAQTVGTNVSITELMPLPSRADQAAGQWVELTNLTNTPINLQGLVLMTTSHDGFHAISQSSELILEPGGVLLLGASTDPMLNGGAPVSYSYENDVLLGTQSDMVFLMKSGQMVDYVSYGNASLQAEKGYSISREPGPPTMATWCLARRPFGLGDYGTPGEWNTYCDNDLDTFSEDEGDCDDTNSVVRPGGTEACNGLDENCNGETDEGVTAPPGTCPTKGVCAGMVPVCEGTAGFSCPAVAGWEPDGETLCDGLDNDCDGLTDELLRFNGLPLGTACMSPGVCGQGTVVCSDMTLRPTCSTMPDGTEPGSSGERCDELDNDCDGFTDEGFDVGQPCITGLGTCARNGVTVCLQDGTAACGAEPGPPMTELCGDRLDNDCDGLTDEGFDVGSPCSEGNGACAVWSRLVCSKDMLGVVCPAMPLEPGEEICDDLVDNDCNGDTDEYGCISRSTGCSTNRTDSGLSLLSSSFLLVSVLAALLAIMRRIRKTADT